AVIKSLFYFTFNVKKFHGKRQSIKEKRSVSNSKLRIYRESIIVKNFLYRSYRTFSQLNF
ncbi:MAG: hypothetical protein KDD94_05975, partial [Calditrichaeota bacterium]|nr:hypothetical protein [Calditrichota bacterium]